MLDIGMGELLGIAVIALLVLGPDKLPKFAADAARFIRQVRSMADSAKEDVRRELDPELQDISLRDLDPRSLVRRHVLDALDLDGPTDNGSRPRPRPGAASPPGEGGAPAPYDADAT
jgi:sec-independent protein translocase protein TatB